MASCGWHKTVRVRDLVRSERAGQRVMESITRFITQKLKLKVNEAKSAVARTCGVGEAISDSVKRQKC
jgi:hypothetical protein